MSTNNHSLIIAFCCLFNVLSLFANDLDSLNNDAIALAHPIETLLELAKKNTHANFPLAIRYAEIAAEKALTEGNIEQMFRVRKRTGLIYEYNNQQNKALVQYTNALEMANKADDDQLRLRIYTDIAIVYRRIADYKESERYHRLGLTLAEKTGNVKGIENSYYGLATLYKDLGIYEKAVEYFHKVVKMTKERGDLGRMVNALQYVASTYAEAGELDAALKTIQETHLSAQLMNDSIPTGVVLFDYGKILGLLGQYDMSLKKYKASLKIFEDLKHFPLMSRSLFYIADTYTQLKDYDSAGQYFEKCQSYAKYMSIKSISDLNYRKGDLYLRQDRLVFARKYFEESLLISEENRFKKLCQKGHYGMYELCQKEGNTAEALKHLKAFNAVKDSLMFDDRRKQVAELQYKYDSVEQTNALKTLELERNQLLLFGAILVFVLIVLFFVYMIHTKNKNNQALIAKNNEIKQKNIKLKESNEVLHQFTYVVAHDLKEPVRNIGSFTSLLKRKYGSSMTEEASEYMKFVTDGAKKMNNLLNDLVAYTEISIQPAEHSLANMGEIVNNLTQNIALEIEKNQAQILYDEHALLHINMEKKHLILLLQQLIMNGIHFNKSEKPLIKINAEDKGEVIQITITDNGIGMDNTYNDRVFKLFYRLNKSSEQKNTGIGLTICKNIVDKYNGSIWYESEINQGTTFFINIPK